MYLLPDLGRSLQERLHYFIRTSRTTRWRNTPWLTGFSFSWFFFSVCFFSPLAAQHTLCQTGAGLTEPDQAVNKSELTKGAGGLIWWSIRDGLRVISSPLVNWLKLKTCPCSFGIEIAEFSRAEEPLHENVVKTRGRFVRWFFQADFKITRNTRGRAIRHA